MNEWYIELTRPVWAPPSWVFGPVWTVLYALIIISFGYVFWRVWHGSVPRVFALPFALNILTNVAFTPLQFGLQIPWLALLDVVAVIATLVWGMVWVWPYARWVVWINIPYLLWGTFAFVLQFSIVWLNW